MALNPGAGYIKNPSSPIVHLWLDGKEITLQEGRPERLLQMEYHRIVSLGANRVQITLFDPTWTLVESSITNLKNLIFKFQYGYAGGEMSPIYEMMILNYKPTFSYRGVQILIEGISVGVFHGDDRQKSASTASPAFANTTGGSSSTAPPPPPPTISDVVIAIAKARKWDYDVEPTQAWTDVSDLEVSDQIQAAFIQPQMRDLPFIMGVLRPRAISLENPDRGDYQVFFTDKEGKPTLHFRPLSFDSGKPVRLFTFMRNNMSEVIDYTPDVNGMINIGLGAGTVACPFIDEQTGIYDYAYASNVTTKGKLNLGGGYTVAEEPDGEGHNLIVTRPASNLQQAEDIAKNAYLTQYNSCQEASLTIVGDVNIPLQRVIQVNVVLPTGKFHYTSGLWYVRECTDQISSGSFTSQMSLIRNSYSADKGNKDLVKAEGTVIA